MSLPTARTRAVGAKGKDLVPRPVELAERRKRHHLHHAVLAAALHQHPAMAHFWVHDGRDLEALQGIHAHGDGLVALLLAAAQRPQLPRLAKHLRQDHQRCSGVRRASLLHQRWGVVDEDGRPFPAVLL